MGLPWKVASALQQPTLECTKCFHKAHAIKWGRYPNGRLICPICYEQSGYNVASKGWYLRQEIIWVKPNAMPESTKDRCSRAHEFIFMLSKSQKYFYDADAIKNKINPSTIKRLQSPT